MQHRIGLGESPVTGRTISWGRLHFQFSGGGRINAITPPAPGSPVHVRDIPPASELETGIGICLSGGGYRAMLFHAGCMLRIAEIGYLGTSDHQINNGVQAGTLQRISSVSGGSITSAILGMNWPKVDVDGPNAGTTFDQEVIGPVCRLASKTIDAKSILSGVFLPGSINKKIIRAYKKHLYGDKTLQVFPDSPRLRRIHNTLHQ